MNRTERYEDKTLKHLQKVQIKIFKYFSEICEQNDLTYFIYAGSLIGTVRHQKFVPWDDDIDVIMFREDFEKLDKIFKMEINEDYEFLNVLNEETYHYTWGRLALKDTVFKEWWADQVDYTPPIFIDIFILDNIPNNKIKRFIHKWSSFTLNQLTMYSYLKYENETKIKQFIQRSIHNIIKFLPISPNFIKRKCVETFAKYQNEKCNEVCDFPAICQMPVYYKTDFLPAKKGKFEDMEVPIPNNYDKVLTRMYGNYMELPPKEKRFRPAPSEIDFGKH